MRTPAETVEGDIPQQHRSLASLAIDPDSRLTLANPFATEATAALLLAELRRRPTYRLASGDAAVTAGTTYVTIASVTPTVPVTVTGFNADFAVLTTTVLRYRARLIIGDDLAPTVLAAEELSTEVNSWIPVTVDIPANTRIAVQVTHGEATTQDFGGTVAHYEEPKARRARHPLRRPSRAWWPRPRRCRDSPRRAPALTANRNRRGPAKFS